MFEKTNVNTSKDATVVSFHNGSSEDFTPQMGCMYNGNAITGKNGFAGIAKGETIVLPYHIGKQLALNLAKYVMNNSVAAIDVPGNPVGKPIWSETTLYDLARSFVKELYDEGAPAQQSETDKLLAKVEEYRKITEQVLEKYGATKDVVVASDSGEFKDKAEVIAELEKKGIAHDKRKSKAELEKLLIVA